MEVIVPNLYISLNGRPDKCEKKQYFPYLDFTMALSPAKLEECTLWSWISVLYERYFSTTFQLTWFCTQNYNSLPCVCFWNLLCDRTICNILLLMQSRSLLASVVEKYAKLYLLNFITAFLLKWLLLKCRNHLSKNCDVVKRVNHRIKGKLRAGPCN